MQFRKMISSVIIILSTHTAGNASGLYAAITSSSPQYYTNITFQWTDLSDAVIPVTSTNGYYPSENQCISFTWYKINNGEWKKNKWAADSYGEDVPCPTNKEGVRRWEFIDNTINIQTVSFPQPPFNLCVELRAQKGGRNDYFGNERASATLIGSGCTNITGLTIPACTVTFPEINHGVIAKSDVDGHVATSSGNITCSTDTTANMSIVYTAGQGSTGNTELTGGGGAPIKNRTTFSLAGGAFQSQQQLNLRAGNTSLVFRDILLGGTVQPGAYQGAIVVLFTNH